MNTTYPKNAYIVNEDGERRKVLEEHGDLRFVSVKQSTSPKYWETTASAYPFHFLELKRDGWVVKSEEKKEEMKPFNGVMSDVYFAGKRMTEEEIQEWCNKILGITAEEKDEWPKVGDRCWFPNEEGSACYTYWENSEYNIRLKTNGFGIYRTREEAQAALRICREALRKAGMME